MECDKLILLKNDEEIREFGKQGWGGTCFEVTDKDIELLKQGYTLGYFDGEYTHTISYNKEETQCQRKDER